MITLAQRNIAATKRAACRTGNKVVETPIRCIIMPGYSLPPARVEIDAVLQQLTAAQLMDIVTKRLQLK